MKDKEVSCDCKENEEVEQHIGEQHLHFLLKGEEEVETKHRTGVEGHDLQVALHHHEDEIRPEGVGPEDERNPVSKEQVEEDAADYEEDE